MRGRTPGRPGCGTGPGSALGRTSSCSFRPDEIGGAAFGDAVRPGEVGYGDVHRVVDPGARLVVIDLHGQGAQATRPREHQRHQVQDLGEDGLAVVVVV